MRYHLVNVIDTESTCYANGIFPPGQTKEVIEIGLCVVDLRLGNIVQTISMPVVPTRSSLSQYCTDLTGWTMAKLKRQGMPFAEAYRRLVDKYGARNRLTVTDSSGDLDLLRTDCEHYGLDYPFRSTLNVGAMFSILSGQSRSLSLQQMLAVFGLKAEGRLHRGSDDAYNIARLLLELQKHCGLHPDSATPD